VDLGVHLAREACDVGGAADFARSDGAESSMEKTGSCQ